MSEIDSLDGFISAPQWWRVPLLTEVRRSRSGVDDLMDGLAEEGRRPFFVIDSALEDQPRFARIFEQRDKHVFDATASEVRTDDVDLVVRMVHDSASHPDTLVGIGGGATMDLAKGAAICTANPKPSREYQGYGLDMAKGADIWVLPTLQGTGAEFTPIAVLRGPEKKLGINNDHAAATVAILDPQLSSGAKKFNRFYTMMDCFFHHFEITQSKTSSPDAIADAVDGRRMSSEVLREGVEEWTLPHAIKSAMASLLGGSSSIGGRVGIPHAISYGLSNSSPTLPHSVAVTIGMLACGDLYKDGGYDETLEFLEKNGMPRPKASDWGIGSKDVEKMTKTALGMEKLWASHFGDDQWRSCVDHDFIEDIYKRIVAE